MKNKKLDKFSCESEWQNWIGQKIEKHSGKPFKSSKKIGIPIAIETNPNSGKLAFRMKDDETLVDCYQCKLVAEIN